VGLEPTTQGFTRPVDQVSAEIGIERSYASVQVTDPDRFGPDRYCTRRRGRFLPTGSSLGRHRVPPRQGRRQDDPRGGDRAALRTHVYEPSAAVNWRVINLDAAVCHAISDYEAGLPAAAA
jgi:hypothetical protein